MKLTDDQVRAMFRAMHKPGCSTRRFGETKRTEGKWQLSHDESEGKA